MTATSEEDLNSYNSVIIVNADDDTHMSSEEENAETELAIKSIKRTDFVCEECGTSLQTRSALKRHTRAHRGDFNYHCTYCKKGFFDVQFFKTHMAKHAGHPLSKVLKCQDCGVYFADEITLGKHVKTHGEYSYRCDLCEKGFFNIGDKKSHMSEYHAEIQNSGFKCKECGKTFKSKSTYNQHIRSHKGDYAYQCTECGSGFFDINSYRGHLHRHTGEKAFYCEVCSKAFSHRSALRSHRALKHGISKLVSASQEKGYAFVFNCSYCGIGFKNNHDLLMHMKSVHFERKLHKCEHCEKKFVLKRSLSEHIKSCSKRPKLDLLDSVLVKVNDSETQMSTEEENAGTETPIEHFVTDDPEDPFNYEATKLLIDGIQKRYERMALVHRRPAIYQEVGEDLRRRGYNISPKDIKKKWCNMVSYFWSLRNRPDSLDWEFFEQLSTFLEVDTQPYIPPTGSEFDQDSTLALIASIRKHYGVLSETAIRDRGAIYSEICEELNSYGYNFNVLKVRRKWNNLVAKYKQVKKRTQVTELWEFFKPMRDLIDPGSSCGPVVIESVVIKERIPVSSVASPVSSVSSEPTTSACLEKFVKIAPVPVVSEVVSVQSSSHESQRSVPVAQSALVITSSPTPSKNSVSVSRVPSTVLLSAPLVSPKSSLVTSSKSCRSTEELEEDSCLGTNNKPCRSTEEPEKDSSLHLNGISERLKLMEEYFSFLKEKESEERLYRKRKERRSRMKVRILSRIGRQLEVLAKTQNEILIKQDKLLKAVNQEKVDK